MVKVDEATVAKLKIQGQHFEIMVDSNLAIAFREGKAVDMKDILAVQRVFSDAKKGLEASETGMKLVFGTADPMEVAKTIIQKGELPLTTEYKEKLREQKRKQIVSIIHRNAVDPKTHHPHPVQRIENALQEAKIHVDEFEDVQKQVQEVLKKIRVVLPIKFEIKEIAVKIPPDYTGKVYGIFASFGKKLKEEWLNDGSLAVVIEIPGGLEEEFYDKLNAVCHGNTETKVLNTR